MTINWFGVLLGYVVDSLVTTLMLMLMPGDVATSYVAGPQLSRPEHLLLFIGSAVSTGIGSYVAGRIGKADGAVHGALVWAVGIVMLQLELLGSGDGLPKSDGTGRRAGAPAGRGRRLALALPAAQRGIGRCKPRA